MLVEIKIWSFGLEETNIFWSVVKSKNSIGLMENGRGKIIWKEKKIEKEILSNLYSPHVTNKPFINGIDWCSITKIGKGGD